MFDPYQLLDVRPDASDDTIKKQYLKKVKAYPPEHHPKMFENVRQAYEKISTHYKRISYALLERQFVSKHDVLQAFIQDEDRRRPTKSEFIRLLSLKLSIK